MRLTCSKHHLGLAVIVLLLINIWLSLLRESAMPFDLPIEFSKCLPNRRGDLNSILIRTSWFSTNFSPIERIGRFYEAGGERMRLGGAWW